MDPFIVFEAQQFIESYVFNKLVNESITFLTFRIYNCYNFVWKIFPNVLSELGQIYFLKTMHKTQDGNFNKIAQRHRIGAAGVQIAVSNFHWTINFEDYQHACSNRAGVLKSIGHLQLRFILRLLDFFCLRLSFAFPSQGWCWIILTRITFRGKSRYARNSQSSPTSNTPSSRISLGRAKRFQKFKNTFAFARLLC